nr:hypothetical protein [Mammaliicoccus lentus]
MEIGKPLKETGWNQKEIYKRLDSLIDEEDININEIEDIEEIIEE